MSSEPGRPANRRSPATSFQPSHSTATGKISVGLATAAENSLAWLVTGTRHLKEPRAATEAELRRLKAICEISFIAALLSGSGDVGRLSDAIAPAVRSAGEGGRFLKALWHQPQHANLYLPLVYALGRRGDLSAEEWSDLPVLLRRLQSLRKERPPFRTLDFLYSLFLLTGNKSFRAAMPLVAEAGCIGANAGLPTFLNGDEYALTHGVFYLTGFGAWPWPFGENNRRSTLALLRALAVEAEAEKNWDLYAEYRIAEALLRPDAAVIGAAPLLSAQREDGSWPGPADLSLALRREGFEDAEESRYFQDYHTTLVAWMALTLPLLHLDPQPLQPPPSLPPSDVVRYPDLPITWLQLPANFTSLLCSGSPAPPDLALSTEPQGVLPWLEWWYWRRRLDPTVAPVLNHGPTLNQSLMEAATSSSWRVLRCSLLASSIGQKAGHPDRQLITRLHRAIEDTPAAELLSAPSVDRLVALALLSVNAALPADALSTFQEVLERTLLLAMLRRDVFVLGPILAFAHDGLVGEMRDQARALMQEAASSALPFGFVDGASAEIQRHCVATECYLGQIELAERLAVSGAGCLTPQFFDQENPAVMRKSP